MNTNEKNILAAVMNDDDAIARYQIDGSYVSFYCVIPYDKPVEQIDVSACIEDTLHRLIDLMESNNADGYDMEGTIFQIMGARTRTSADGDFVQDIDRGYVFDGPVLSFTREPLSAFHFQKMLYERFKLIWMLDHHHSLLDFAEEFRDFTDPANGFTDTSTENALDEWEGISGFSGSLYPYFGEFIGYEYQAGDERMFFSKKEHQIWKMDQDEEAEKDTYDVVLIQKPYGCESGDFRTMLGYFSDEDGLLPMFIEDWNGQAYAYGFIREETADKLDYALDPLKEYVRTILGNTDLETEDGVYEADIKNKYTTDTMVHVRMLMQYKYY